TKLISGVFRVVWMFCATAVTLMTCDSPGPALMPVRLIVRGAGAGLVCEISRNGAGLGMMVIVGAWVTGVTVTRKGREIGLVAALAVLPLSVTVTVMTAVPLALGAGVRTSVPVLGVPGTVGLV